MAQSIILKRSAQEGKTPDTGSLNLGELAINTYDGKVFLKKSGSVESIQTLVTTDSVTTGSVTLTGDLTVQGAVNARQFNISVISSSVIYQSGSTQFGDTLDDTHSFTGSVNVTGSLFVNGTEIGGTGEGSYTGSFTGSFIGDGSQLRGVITDDIPIDGWDYDSNSSASISEFNISSSKYLIDFQWEQEVGTPVGLKAFVSNTTAVSQVVPTKDGVKIIAVNEQMVTVGPNDITIAGTLLPEVSNSIDLGSVEKPFRHIYVGTGSIYLVNPQGAVTKTLSANTIVTTNDIASGSVSLASSLPAGTVSSSAQLTSTYDTRYVLSGSITQTTWDNIASKPDGILSSSLQLPTGIISGSSQLPSGILSSSTHLSALNSYTASLNNAIQLTGSTVSFWGDIVVYGTQSVINSTNIELSDNILYLAPSASGDFDLGVIGHYNDGTYRHGGIFRDASDGGAWKVFKGLETETTGAYVDTAGTGFALADFKAATITATSFVGSVSATNGVISGSSQLPTGIVSGSSQVDVMSTTNIAKLATTGSNTFIGNQTITGSVYITGSSYVNGGNFGVNTISPKAAFQATPTSSGVPSIPSLGATNGYVSTYFTNSNTNYGLLGGSLNNGNYWLQVQRTDATATAYDLALQPNGGNITIGGGMTISGNILPEANGTRDLGSSSYRWSTIYTSDLSLNNGIGDWTIVEGEDDLFLYNNKKGKVYKFALTEVDPKDATPKIS